MEYIINAHIVVESLIERVRRLEVVKQEKEKTKWECIECEGIFEFDGLDCLGLTCPYCKSSQGFRLVINLFLD